MFGQGAGTLEIYLAGDWINHLSIRWNVVDPGRMLIDPHALEEHHETMSSGVH